MATSGPRVAGTGADDATVGTVAWGTPGNVTASDDTRTTASLAGGTTHYLKATNFGDFAIPTGSTIVGIEVRFERSATIGAPTDSAVRIVKPDGTISTTNRSAGAAWAGTEGFVTFGGASDLWGETWTPANFNDADTGVVIAATGTGTCSVDSVDMKVYYTPPLGSDPMGMMGLFGM